MFTGVSGSGKSSLVFGTIAAESQRLINETYSAFVQGFMPSLARPDVDLLAAVAAMKGPDGAMAKRLHSIVTAAAPDLWPKTWYGMPAYAKDGRIVCFFQAAEKFKARYATFGFNDEAKLDEGNMWPTSFALKKLTAAEEAKIGALVKKAVR